MKNKNNSKKKFSNFIRDGIKFYGTTKVGTKGQMVIPVKARKELNITPEDQLLVFSKTNAGFSVIKIEEMEKFLSIAQEGIKEIKKNNK